MQRRPSLLAALTAVVLLSLAAAPEARARADRAYATPPQAAPRKATFWERVKSPHLDEIRRLSAEAVYLRQKMSFRCIWAEHQAMLNAIVEGDAGTAERLSREHAENACQMMLKLLFREDEDLGQTA